MGAELKLWRTEVALPLTGLKANVCESWDAFGHSKKEWTALLDQLLVAYCIPYVIVLSASSKPAARHLQSSPWLQFFFFSPPHLGYHCHYLCCSVARLYLTLQDSSWTGARQASLSFTVSQSLFKFMSTESVMLSNHLILCHSLFLLPSIFPSIKVFSNEFFASGGQSVGASASATVLPMNIQGQFPLGLIGLISLLSKGLSRVSSNDTDH